MQLNETGNDVRKSRNSLYVVAAVFGIYSIAQYGLGSQGQNEVSVVVTNMVLAIVFLLLGFWSMTKPVAAIISGLTLYVAVQLLNFIVEPVTLFQGIAFTSAEKMESLELMRTQT